VLTAIKLFHTLVWAFLAGSILALPVLAILRRFRWAAILTVIVLLECVVLAANGGRCPLTDLAARYTLDRAPNFDIYVPNWLARYNKAIFGTLFVLSELIVVLRWRGSALEQTVKAENWTELPEPGGVNWTRRKLLPAERSASSRHPRRE
jgi:hypothetical protein